MYPSTDLIDLSEYPKEIVLPGKSRVWLRPCASDDSRRLFSFFKKLSESDRRHFKHDVGNRKTLDAWCENLDYDRVLPILAVVRQGEREKIIGNATLHTERHGWSTHVGRIRVQVTPQMRKKGLGQILLRELCDRAAMRGIDKIQAHVRKDNPDGIRMMKSLGFHKEGVFKKHVIDDEGRRHDVLIYYQDLEALWKKMEDLNLDLDLPSLWP